MVDCVAKSMSFTSDAQARAYYACQYFAAVEKNANVNLAIAGIQQAAAFYFADKQHDIAKKAQSRLDEQWKHNKEHSDAFFKHWNDNAKPEELEQLKKASDREEKGYQVDYKTAKNRAIVEVRSEFGRAREKLERERKTHCTGANRYANRQLAIAEARAAVAAVNQAYRAEENRKDLKEAQFREELYKWIALFRGSIGDSLNASRSALAATSAQSQINPYSGWAQAFGGLSNLGGRYGEANFMATQTQLSGVYSGLFNNGMPLTPTGSVGAMGNAMPSQAEIDQII